MVRVQTKVLLNQNSAHAADSAAFSMCMSASCQPLRTAATFSWWQPAYVASLHCGLLLHGPPYKCVVSISQAVESLQHQSLGILKDAETMHTLVDSYICNSARHMRPVGQAQHHFSMQRDHQLQLHTSRSGTTGETQGCVDVLTSAETCTFSCSLIS